MSSKKQYTTEQEFLKGVKTFIDKSVPVGTQTGWREFAGGYVHYVNGHMQNDPTLGVAVVKFSVDGNLKTEEFREKGHRHRLDGPAVVEYSLNGGTLKEEYYINGINYDYTTYQAKAKAAAPKPTYLEFGKLKININSLESAFGDSLKKDANGNITNVRLLKESKKSYGSIRYDLLDKETIYVNHNMVFRNVYDPIKPCVYSFDTNGIVDNPEYYTEPHSRVDNWKSAVFKPNPKSTTGVPLWIEFHEFPQLGLTKDVVVQEYKTAAALKLVLDDFMSPFNKSPSLFYVYQDNFFYVLKDHANNLIYEKRIPLRPSLAKNDTEIDMSWESEPTTYLKAGYVAGVTSKPVSISKEEFMRSHQILTKQKTAIVQNASPITAQVPTVQVASPDFIGKETFSKIAVELGKMGYNVVPSVGKDGSIELKFEPTILNGSGSMASAPFLDSGSMSKVWDSESKLSIPLLVSGAAPIGQQQVNLYVTSTVDAKDISNLFEKKAPSPPQQNKFIQVAKSDAKEVAKRIAAKQVTSFVHDMLVNFLTNKQKKAKTEIENFLMSEKGKVLLGFAVGATIPLITNHFPEKYREALMEIGSEFRVQAETEVAVEITDNVISPFLAQLGTGLSAFEVFSGNNAEKVRVDVGESLTASPTSSIEDEAELLEKIEVEKNQKTLN